ncbi:MAG: hypothetical protein HZA20_11590 [Nitrospirae bacterium]|nr:hypothetical protein [Nitrospirota bacterium]
MRQITLRGIPEEIESIARKEADGMGVSLNKALLMLLRKGAARQASADVKISAPKGRFKAFSGLWSEDEAADFDASLREQRSVDAEIWK